VPLVLVFHDTDSDPLVPDDTQYRAGPFDRCELVENAIYARTAGSPYEILAHNDADGWHLLIEHTPVWDRFTFVTVPSGTAFGG
jgi:hypothetical protein